MSAALERIGRAIAEGRQSREALAGQLAREFRNDPAKFDPSRLERLGGTGLRRFLGEIGLDGATPQPPESSTPQMGSKGRRRQHGSPSIASRLAASAPAGMAGVDIRHDGGRSCWRDGGR